jgi:uncharacterized membrane protein
MSSEVLIFSLALMVMNLVWGMASLSAASSVITSLIHDHYLKYYQ